MEQGEAGQTMDVTHPTVPLNRHASFYFLGMIREGPLEIGFQLQ